MTASALHKACVSTLLAVLLLALPASAKLMVPQDFTAITIVLDGGWEMPNLTVRWSDPDGGLWAVRSDGARRLYKPQEMVGLTDASGRDITRDVMPDWAVQRLAIAPSALPPVQTQPHDFYQPSDSEVGGTPKESSSQQVQPAQVPAPSNDWRFLLGVEAGWSKPREGDFLDSEGGMGADVAVRLQIAGALYLAGGYSWQAVPVSASYMPLEPREQGMVEYEDWEDGKLRGYWAGLSIMPPGDSGASARFYIEGGVGRFVVENLPVQSGDDAYMGYHAGAGFMIPLGTAAALDMGVRAKHIVNLDLGYGDDQHTLLGFRLGLSILAR